MQPKVGIPYGRAIVRDDLGYGVMCPECPFIAWGEGKSEDSVTKSAGRGFAEHWVAEHRVVS